MEKPVFWAQTVWSVYVQGMDLMVDHLVSQGGRMKMVLAPAKDSLLKNTVIVISYKRIVTSQKY